MNEFLAMGGYAVYVWPAYGITAVVLIASLLVPWLQNRSLRVRIRRLLQEQD